MRAEKPKDSMIGRTISMKRVALEDQGVPAERAAVKAEGTIVGTCAAVLGMLGLAIPGGLASLIVWRGGELTIVVGIVLGGIALGGLVLFGVGMTLVSRDAAPAIAAVGELLVKIVRAVRGVKGGDK